MNIVEILRSHVTDRADAAAIIDGRGGSGRIITFAGLERSGGRAAALLRQAGLRAGDAVLIFQPMSAELYIALQAIFQLGLVAMFLDPWAGSDYIERCCALYPPRAFIASSKAQLLRVISPALRRIPIKFSIGPPVPGAIPWHRAEGLAPYELTESCTPETPALVTFTSGSTGNPKAAVRTHGFLLAQHRALREALALAPGEIDLTTLPIFVLANLASGVTSLIPDADLRYPGAIDPARIVAQLEVHRPTRIGASPAFLERLMPYCTQNGWTLSSLRDIFTGGAPVFPCLLDKLQRIAPLAEITSVYGSTEAEPIAHFAYHEIEPEDIAAMLAGRGLLAGLPVPSIRLQVVLDRWGTPIGPYTRTEFLADCLRPGKAGEIVVSGDHVLASYLNKRDDEESKFSVDGAPWHRTGDAGYLDDRGRLWLLGRCGARIEDAHGTLYPFTVECIAHHHPGVRRAAVVSHRGRRILAVELDDYVTDMDLDPLRHALAWARISEVQEHERIPVDKRHNAKIDYPALQGLLDRSN